MLPGQQSFYRGKVRDVYDLGDQEHEQPRTPEDSAGPFEEGVKLVGERDGCGGGKCHGPPAVKPRRGRSNAIRALRARRRSSNGWRHL